MEETPSGSGPRPRRRARRRWRRRGGQPGNQNARKHGFYSAALLPHEREVYREAAGLRGLNPEIAMLRTKLMGLISTPDVNPEVLIKAARALTRMVDIQDRLTHGRW